ncbi:MAG: hypothetical protein GEEBNDBF_01895 [bacterium]|nr:hypothetical protein [bacterium]
MWEKFTPGALDIIRTATREARLSGQPAVDTSHLLFSMMRQKGDAVRAAQVLRDFDLRPEEVYSELIAAHLQSPTDGKLPLAPEAESVLRNALQTAKEEQFPRIGGDQLLLGLLRTPEAVATRYLSTRGITPETAQLKLIELALLEDIDFHLGQTRDQYTPLARRATRSLRRSILQGVKQALESKAGVMLPSHVLSGALLGDNELTAQLRTLDFPNEILYRNLTINPPEDCTPAAPSPATLPPAPALIALIQEMEQEAQSLGDPQLSTIHLLLAILHRSKDPLHDAMMALSQSGDVNMHSMGYLQSLCYDRIRERIIEQRSSRAE